MARYKRTMLVVALVAVASCDRTPVQPPLAGRVTPPDASVSAAPTIDIFPDEYFSGIVFPGACASFTVTVRDEQGNIVNNPIVTWTLADNRVAYFSNNNAAVWTGQGAALVCGQANGFGYTDVSARWTSPTSPNPTATDSRPIEYGQTSQGYQPQTVTLSPPSKDLYPGQNEYFTATGTDQFGHTRQVLNDFVDWSSSDANVVTVIYNGTATAVAKGSANIIADVHGRLGTAAILVLGVETMAVTPNPITVCLGTATGANATPRDQRGNVWPNGVIDWSSSNSNIATVTFNSGQGNSGHRVGVVYGVAEGQASAIAALDGISGSSPITVAYCAPSASVSGPYTMNLYQYGRFTAIASAGVPPYTYEFRRMDCPVGGFNCQPWSMWNARGSTNYWDTIVYGCDIQHIYVQARVTDSRGNVSGPSGQWKTYINNPC